MIHAQPPNPNAENWAEARCGDWGALAALADDARAELALTSDLDDPEYVAAAQGWPDRETLLLVNRIHDRLAGIMVFGVSTAPLIRSIGPVELWRRPVRRYYFRPGPILSRADSAFGVEGCFECLADRMSDDDVVFAYAVPVESELHSKLSDRRGRIAGRFHVLPWGTESPSCSIAWDGSVERYLRTISSNSRHDLRRRRKNFLADSSLRSELRCFSSTGDVDLFLRDGIRVSDRSWQKAAKAGGIEYGGPVENKIRRAARRGEFLGYILYMDGQPAAFQYCFLYGQNCTVEQIGYDSAWAERHHVGSILFFEVLHAFEREKLPIRTIDFLAGATTFKLRTTNTVSQCRNFYLFKRSWRGTAMYASMRGVAAASRLLAGMAHRFGFRRPEPLRRGEPATMQAGRGATTQPRSIVRE